jgi:uncharacterized surface protein with fasciclin (FAS1) repeats
MPGWLGSSIYDWLKDPTDGRSYENFVKLIDDLDYAEVLQKTGSKTIFVASDSAFDVFYKNNDWNVTCYEDLSTAQKKLLLNSAMLNNANLLEMLSNTAGSGDNTSTAYITKAECLRRVTATAVTDSVAYFGEGSEELPYSYNATDQDYWSRFRSKGITLAMDNTAPMMTVFTSAQMSAKNITNEDFRIITGQTRTDNDTHIYDARVILQDQTCQNGYIDVLDKVLITPPNMAEMLRTNGETNIFSHIMERFSYPSYNSTLTDNYITTHEGVSVDSVFQKRYFSDRSQGGSKNTTDPDGNTVGATLKFDPGWNQYSSSDNAKESDMAAIFAPTDSILTIYFLEGSGKPLLESYAPDYKPFSKDNLTQAIDQIPMDVIQALARNLMQSSFIGTVPSKFTTVMNDATDELGVTTGDVKKCLLANNGVIYLVNAVFSPADYAAVSAPAYVGQNMKIFNWAIQDGSNLGLNFYAYLKAMSSRFSFFIPTDEAMTMVYSYANHGRKTPYCYTFTWDEKTKKPLCKRGEYDPDTKKMKEGATLTNVTGTEMYRVLKDLLETHTIVHSTDEYDCGMEQNKKWYIAKNGAPIYAPNIKTRVGAEVYGGWQIQNSDPVRVTEFYDQTAQTNGYGNGFTYVINHPLQTTTSSVFDRLSEIAGDNAVSGDTFKELCETDEALLVRAGFVADGETLNDDGSIKKSNTAGKSMRNRYLIFTNDNGLTQNVKFFNSYNYTVLVPSNEAVRKAIKERGLPTWPDIEDYLNTQEAKYDAMKEGYASEADIPEAQLQKMQTFKTAYQTKAQAMISCLVNVVKNHFMDNSFFADDYSYSQVTESSVIDTTTNVYAKIAIECDGNSNITAQGETNSGTKVGKAVKVLSNKNLVARDYVFNATVSDKAGNYLNTSSFAVIHEIDDILDFMNYPDNRYDNEWKTVDAARRYLKKYPVKQ